MAHMKRHIHLIGNGFHRHLHVSGTGFKRHIKIHHLHGRGFERHEHQHEHCDRESASCVVHSKGGELMHSLSFHGRKGKSRNIHFNY